MEEKSTELRCLDPIDTFLEVASDRSECFIDTKTPRPLICWASLLLDKDTFSIHVATAVFDLVIGSLKAVCQVDIKQSTDVN